MSKILLKTENCKACGNCIRNCKKNALRFSSELNAKGYRTVVVDRESCVDCGLCYTVCPDYVFGFES